RRARPRARADRVPERRPGFLARSRGARARAAAGRGGALSSRACPDWPRLMEIAPDLQFMHYTVAEANLPAQVLPNLQALSLHTVAICCDLERHVFNPE